ncbi:MAG: ATP-binding protein [Candidatus Dadabacteria bacterium]|nr:MAG: ATP-binding protein [Candidatus Dadabacteria bacterium]
MIKRYINLSKLLERKSFFFFGPRGVGKTTLIHSQLKDRATIINLLDSRYFTKLLAEPSLLEEIAAANKSSLVVIDEIQKIPSLLDEVHRLIEEKGIRFLLTGSSARKLRRGGVNLLAGRAWKAELFPLTYYELDKRFNLERYLKVGGLPSVYLSSDPEEELFAYVDTYLKEEIMHEALVRRLPPFTRFLASVALSSGNIINYTKIANDAQLSPSTAREYFHLLEDTLIGFTVPPWRESKKRKAIQTAKFYLFDIGVVNTLQKMELGYHSLPDAGKSFEHFIAMELRAFLSYTRNKSKLTFWRSIYGQEVDFVIGQQLALEVKLTKTVTKRHLKGLKAIKEEGVFSKYFIISQDKIPAEDNGIIKLHWKDFLDKLWNGEIL